MLAGDCSNNILPEAHRFGVRIIDTENSHTFADPQFKYPDNFLFDPRHIFFEINRIDILIFLRRVLGKGNRPVRPDAEPVRVLLYPWVVR